MSKKKSNELFTHISTKNITELNELIYAGVKIVRKNCDSSKEHECAIIIAMCKSNDVT